MGLEQLDREVCRSLVHIVAAGCLASPSEAYRGRQWERRAAKLPGHGQSNYITPTDPGPTYHSGTWNTIPAESDTITVLHLAELIFESVVVHGKMTCPGKNTVLG